MGKGATRDTESEAWTAESKRRKVPRACDICRRRKIRCDGPQKTNDNDKCTHCQDNKFECTYVEEASRKGPPKGYLQALEERCGRLEALVEQMRPGTDVEPYVGPRLDRDLFDLASHNQRLREYDIPMYPSTKRFLGFPSRSIAQPSSPSATHMSVSEHMPMLNHAPMAGTSDTQTAIPPSLPRALRSYTSEPNKDLYMAVSQVSQMVREEGRALRYYEGAAAVTTPTSNQPYKGETLFARELDKVKRPRMWRTPEWEVVTFAEGEHALDLSIFPDEEQGLALIWAYFHCLNSHLPLLNKDLFIQQYRARKWKRDHEFGKMLLLVFANAARFVPVPVGRWGADEPKYRGLREEDHESIRLSAGWRYVRAYMHTGSTLRKTPTLLWLQQQVLLCAFLRGNASASEQWAIASQGLLSCQEIGIHTSAHLPGVTAVDRELYSRAFWCLYHYDRSACVTLGRAVALADAEIDAPYPLAVDDRWWDISHPDEPIIQPAHAGVPHVSGFIYGVQLDRIISSALLVIPARADPTMRDKLPAIIAEIVHALHVWFASLPPLLSWDPQRSLNNEGDILRTTHLHARYHWTRIIVHYSPVAAAMDTTSLPARELFAVPLDAARMLCEICGFLLSRESIFGPLTQKPLDFEFLDYAFLAGAVTLLGVHAGVVAHDDMQAAQGVQTCIDTCRQMDFVSRRAGQVSDLLVLMRHNVAVRVGGVWALGDDVDEKPPTTRTGEEGEDASPLSLTTSLGLPWFSAEDTAALLMPPSDSPVAVATAYRTRENTPGAGGAVVDGLDTEGDDWSQLLSAFAMSLNQPVVEDQFAVEHHG